MKASLLLGDSSAALALGHVRGWQQHPTCPASHRPTDLLSGEQRQGKMRSTHTQLGGLYQIKDCRVKQTTRFTEKHFCTRKPSSEIGFLETERALAAEKQEYFLPPT